MQPNSFEQPPIPQKPSSTEPVENSAPRTPAHHDFSKEIPLFERLRYHPIFENITEKKKEVGYFLLCFILTIVLITTLVSRSRQYKAHDEHLASLYAKELKKTAKIFAEESALEIDAPKSQKELFESLLQIAKKDPEVEKLYSGLIAQELLLSGNKEAQTFAQNAIVTLQQNQLNLFARFSEITHLTSQNLLKEALEKTNALVEDKELATILPLYATTLLQKQNLEKALGFEDAAEKTKDTLRAFLKTEQARNMPKLEQLFKDGDHSIFDFKA